MSSKSDSSDHITPLMRQFNAIKAQHPGKILFFRMGDFYEMFGEDAVRAAPILGIALTSRSQGNTERIPLAVSDPAFLQLFIPKQLDKIGLHTYF